MERTNSAHLSNKRGRPIAMTLLSVLALTLVLSALFLCLLAFLLYKTPDPLRLLTPALYITPLLGGLFAGYRTTSLRPAGGAFCGLLAGALLSLLLLLVGLILTGGQLPFSSLLLYLGVLLTSFLGGFLASRRRGKRKRHKR